MPQERIIILRLKPALLARFALSPSLKATSSSNPESPINDNVANDDADRPSDVGTPLPSVASGVTPDPDTAKRKGPRPGVKRNSSTANLDRLMNGKGRPGPKKKPRLYVDHPLEHSDTYLTDMP